MLLLFVKFEKTMQMKRSLLVTTTLCFLLINFVAAQENRSPEKIKEDSIASVLHRKNNPELYLKKRLLHQNPFLNTRECCRIMDLLNAINHIWSTKNISGAG